MFFPMSVFKILMEEKISRIRMPRGEHPFDEKSILNKNKNKTVSFSRVRWGTSVSQTGSVDGVGDGPLASPGGWSRRRCELVWSEPSVCGLEE